MSCLRASAKPLIAAVLVLCLWPEPGRRRSTCSRGTRSRVEFATADGKPLADAEVRVFAPGQPGQPALTGRTDSAGKFEFPADEDGLWSAEARTGDEIARVTIRVGGPATAAASRCRRYG